MHVGPCCKGQGRCQFLLWAPHAKEVTLKIVSDGRLVPMEARLRGYWRADVNDCPHGTRYCYLLDGRGEFPDPASPSQPDGVHGASEVIDHGAFGWEDDSWRVMPLSEMIIYELHVGTFSPEGTFASVAKRLDELCELGVNAVEIMPVSQFPGERNWGYDGAYHFAVQNSYGGPDGLRSLVNECHRKGMAVILDVVYNHFGPEGTYLREFGPYFTDRYWTPWGEAVNFDGPLSDGVRNFFVENALHWFDRYHMDGLRLDAVHAIHDMRAVHILEELEVRVERYAKTRRRQVYLIAESDLNDARLIRPRTLGGYGLSAQWCDDFHHAAHALLTCETEGYYVDYGKINDLVVSLREGFVLNGRYSEYRRRHFGGSSRDREADQFIVFTQNHDQVGNRMLGERMSTLVSFEALKLSAGLVMLSPFIPLLFMGEEYGETNPFLYFVSHSDHDLIEAVRKGRREEFSAFTWRGQAPDPASPEVFQRSVLDWEKRREGRHRVLLDFYRRLIAIRREVSAFGTADKEALEVSGDELQRVLVLRRWADDCEGLVVFNLSSETQGVPLTWTEGKWEKILESSDMAWDGPGPTFPERAHKGHVLELRGLSFAVFVRQVAN